MVFIPAISLGRVASRRNAHLHRLHHRPQMKENPSLEISNSARHGNFAGLHREIESRPVFFLVDRRIRGGETPIARFPPEAQHSKMPIPAFMGTPCAHHTHEVIRSCICSPYSHN
ncbi:hypothetical protein BofuT4_P048830.1 [Botrytis cinerea T4]|uniref:Uncharacterized protein n=1 Tax=Botryotinia fuckeliana (strain T4) TaxID=999810 RepID=G2XZH8_BOTF4|nr:hypothetical protein BofuT4_P048830.1 [Botrytis cinerea T4]